MARDAEEECRSGPQVSTVYAELEDMEEKRRQTPPWTGILERSMGNNTIHVQEQEGSEMMAIIKESGTAVLAIPPKEDTLIILCSKLTAIMEAVVAGQSVAVATAYAAATSPDRHALRRAISQMPPFEAKVWTWFATGSCALPDMEWKTSIDTTPRSPRPLMTAQRRAEALNRLYKTDQAHPPHWVWFTKHHSVYLPLVKAMARVIGAERDLIGGGVWTATQLADLQSINNILSVTAQIVKGNKHKPQLRAITRAQAVLVSYRDNLRNLVVGRKRKRST